MNLKAMIRIFLLSLFAVLLAACSNVIYQQRDEFVPDGYSELPLEDGSYVITYETYKNGVSFVLLSEYAQRRAAELALANDKEFFEVLSVEHFEITRNFKIPEQRVSHGYSEQRGTLVGHFGGGSTVTVPSQSATLIPAHIQKFRVKSVELTVSLSDEQTADTVAAHDYIPREKSRLHSEIKY